MEQVKPLEENVDVMEPTKPGTKDTREKTINLKKTRKKRTRAKKTLDIH